MVSHPPMPKIAAWDGGFLFYIFRGIAAKFKQWITKQGV